MAMIVPAEAGAAVRAALAGPAGRILCAIGVGLTAVIYISKIFRSKAEDARKKAI